MNDQPAKRAKRSDAIANHTRLLEAAGAVVGEQGVEAPMHDFADRAGVGIGTLYRHFPDRHALLMALDEILVARAGELFEEAVAAPTGWDGLVAHLDGSWRLYTELPWALAVRDYAHQFRGSDPVWERKVRDVIELAWAEGALRTDIEWTDALFMPSLLSGLAILDEPVRSIVYRRQRDLILDGFRAEGIARHPPGGEPLAERTIREYVHMPEPDAAED